jgi:hypothetical protein
VRFHLPNTLALFALCIFFASCSDDGDSVPPDTIPDPLITSFTPSQGILGNSVSISGDNFSPVAVDNIVQFNGTPAVVQTATSKSLTVIVPDSATTGKLKVTVAGKASESADDFTILAPAIESVEPMIGSPGLTVRIAGENFSPDIPSNAVRIGAEQMEILSATATQIDFQIPEGVATGTLVLQVGTQRSHTQSEFEICDGVPELIVSDIVISSTNASMDQLAFSCRITNVGNVDLDLSQMVMQNYVSEDGVYDYADSPAGGWVLDSGGILGQGESYENTWSANVNYSTKRNLIVTIFAKDGSTQQECNSTNNSATKAIE